MKQKIRNHLHNIHHFLVSIVLITKGYTKIEHHHSIIGWTILILGIAVLLYFIFLKLTGKGTLHY